MRPQSILLGAVCLLIAPAPNGSHHRVQGLIATRDIVPAEKLDSSNTRIALVEADQFSGSILQPDELADRFALVRIPKGGRVTLDNVTTVGNSSWPHDIPLGQRAITVSVTTDCLPSRRERVNLAVRFRGFADSPPILLMHNIEVFAVDKYAGPGTKTNLSVLVTVEAAYEFMKTTQLPDVVCEVERFDEPPLAARVRVGFFE